LECCDSFAALSFCLSARSAAQKSIIPDRKTKRRIIAALQKRQTDNAVLGSSNARWIGSSQDLLASQARCLPSCTPRLGLRSREFLLLRPQRPDEELYDLKADPHEQTNLAGEKKHAERLMKAQGDTKKFFGKPTLLK
jgi:hypothetical protein